MRVVDVVKIVRQAQEREVGNLPVVIVLDRNNYDSLCMDVAGQLVTRAAPDIDISRPMMIYGVPVVLGTLGYRSYYVMDMYDTPIIHMI